MENCSKTNSKEHLVRESNGDIVCHYCGDILGKTTEEIQRILKRNEELENRLKGYCSQCNTYKIEQKLEKIEQILDKRGKPSEGGA